MMVLNESSDNPANSWVMEVDNLIDDVNRSEECEHWSNRSIYMVPLCMKQLNKNCYNPTVVSLGPFHHGDVRLAAFEQHKHRALLHFLNRTRRPLDHFLDPLRESLPTLMEAYTGLDEKWKEDGGNPFLKLMVFDACFVLEVLRFRETNVDDYASNDPIFSDHGILYSFPYIRRDMLMIENQIPLLALKIIVDVEYGSEDEDMNRMVMRFFEPGKWRQPKMPMGLHILDVFRKSRLHLSGGRNTVKKKKKKEKNGRRDVGDVNAIVRSAMELDEAGIKLKVSRTESLRDISFKHGILRLPEMTVDDATESKFLNMMAFERLHVGTGNEITSYVFFMDNIIDSEMDVSLLHSKKIIHNALGSDKAVAKLFNSLSKDVTLDPDSSLDGVHRRVSNYCGKRWNMWRANLLHTYFRSPWAFISLAAAIFLLGLTVVQTVYSVLPYYVPTSN